MRNNVFFEDLNVSVDDRERLVGQRGKLFWFTGLSGSGKSTIARSFASRLVASGILAYVLDGDQLRSGLNSDLGFSRVDRAENIRRVMEISKLLIENGVVVIASFISPFRSDREMVRKSFGERFVEVYVECSKCVCERRDVKGLYRRARLGEISDFTGVSQVYEEPLSPEVKFNTSFLSISACVSRLLYSYPLSSFRIR